MLCMTQSASFRSLVLISLDGIDTLETFGFKPPGTHHSAWAVEISDGTNFQRFRCEGAFGYF